MTKMKLTFAQVLRRRRSQLRKALRAELALQGVEMLGSTKVRYGSLVAPAEWRFEARGNLTVRSTWHGIVWLHGRASTPEINAQEPVYACVNVSALLGSKFVQ